MSINVSTFNELSAMPERFTGTKSNYHMGATINNTPQNVATIEEAA
ncbi:hypothetical protein IPU75_05165 [Ochrobactrum sp. SD129]|nr:hypothetical protein [Ochrobactrum sp. SD129]